MANLPISGLPTASALDGTELLPFVQGGVTTQANVQNILDANLPLTSSGISVGNGNITPTSPQGASLGTAEMPFKEIFLQSGSISIESDIPGEPSTILSNVGGNIQVSAGGMRLSGSGAFIATTGSFQYLSGSLTRVGDDFQIGDFTQIGDQTITGSFNITGSFTASLRENYIWIGDSNNRSMEVPVSTITSIFPFNYGLFNQTGSSIPVTNTTSELSLLDGGIGTLTVPANNFKKGDAFHAILTGDLSAINNNTLQIRIKAGSIVLADTGVMTMAGATNKDWEMEVYFSINEIGAATTSSISTGGNFNYTKDASTSLEGTIFSTSNNTTFDTTISNTLSITAQWGTANSGSSIYSQICTLNKTF
jgi:hypothetical protein